MVVDCFPHESKHRLYKGTGLPERSRGSIRHEDGGFYKSLLLRLAQLQETQLRDHPLKDVVFLRAVNAKSGADRRWKKISYKGHEYNSGDVLLWANNAGIAESFAEDAAGAPSVWIGRLTFVKSSSVVQQYEKTDQMRLMHLDGCYKPAVFAVLSTNVLVL